MVNSIRPNGFHRVLHRFLMLQPVTAILIRILHRVDALVWKLNGGRFSLTSLLAGLPTFKVTTIGAKSKLPRIVPLLGICDGDRIALIASNFGQAHHPSWYHNLKANPGCHVQMDGVEEPYLARQAEGEEYERYWTMAVSLYAGYAAYKTRAGKRRIPVMILRPRKELPDS